MPTAVLTVGLVTAFSAVLRARSVVWQPEEMERDTAARVARVRVRCLLTVYKTCGIGIERGNGGRARETGM